MRFFAGWGLISLAVASVALGSCGQNRPTASHATSAAQPAPVAVSKDGPPTDAEVLSAFVAYWNATVPQQFGDLGQEEYRVITPVGVHQLEGAVTRDTPVGKFRSVNVSFSFRANAPLTYQCSDAWGYVVLARASAPGAFPTTVNAGDVVSCVKAETFSTVEEGWIVSFDMSGKGYLIKR